MSQAPVTILKGTEEGNYCLHLKSLGQRLAGVFSQDNSVRVWDAASGTQIWTAITPTRKVLSEVCWAGPETVACCSTDGLLLIYDIRQPNVVSQRQEREALYTLDASGYSLASGGDKSVAVWDIRTFEQKHRYQDAHVPDFDITNVRFSPLYPNVLASCSEDALLAIYNVETAEEDFCVISLEEAGQQLGWDGLNVYAVTISTHQLWQPNLDDNEAPSTLLLKKTLSTLQVATEDFQYFLPCMLSQNVFLGGSNV
jgi:WD40 repeat protein